jgi:hypothetical protein
MKALYAVARAQVLSRGPRIGETMDDDSPDSAQTVFVDRDLTRWADARQR